MMREGEDHILYTTRDTAEQQDTRARDSQDQLLQVFSHELQLQLNPLTCMCYFTENVNGMDCDGMVQVQLDHFETILSADDLCHRVSSGFTA